VDSAKFIDIVSASRLEPLQDGVLLLIDLDDFGMINETYGYKKGDFVLQLLVARLAYRFPKHRIGKADGSAFLMFADIDSAEKEELASAVLGTIAEPIYIKSDVVTMTASIGIAEVASVMTTEQSLLAAKVALGDTKKRRRGTFLVSSEDAVRSRKRTVQLKRAFYASDLEKQFYLVYQPQIDIKTGLISGAEALVRWQHPVFGLISPSEFIPIAEGTRFIERIGRHVLHEACQQCKAWCDETGKRLTIAVNISPWQVIQPDFFEEVVRTLAETELDASLLEIELTEHVAFEDEERIIERLKSLQALGVNIALDDFGMGYSSLQTLARLPIQQLKFHRELIASPHNSKTKRAVIETIVLLGKRLGKTIVAEGIENEEEAALVRSLGCDRFQGYLFHKPLRAEGWRELLTS